MRRLEQTRILHPSELLGEVEAEAEGSRDVKEVQRNPGGSSECSRNSPGRDRLEP